MNLIQLMFTDDQRTPVTSVELAEAAGITHEEVCRRIDFIWFSGSGVRTYKKPVQMEDGPFLLDLRHALAVLNSFSAKTVNKDLWESVQHIRKTQATKLADNIQVAQTPEQEEE